MADDEPDVWRQLRIYPVSKQWFKLLAERLDDVPAFDAQHTDALRMAIDLRDRWLEIDRQVIEACAPSYDWD